MGIYLNPGKRLFEMSLNSEIYVDKTGMIAYTNKVLCSEQRYICVSRPRRFGKSMAANMLAAYYDKSCDSGELFVNLKIAQDKSYEKYKNQYNVVRINMQEFLSEGNGIDEMLGLLKKSVLWDLIAGYKEIEYFDKEKLSRTMADIYQQTQIPFIILIDEWDCIFREYREDKEAQEKYLDFLRNWLKDKDYVALAYMTGILPIKKYGTHSALNMFQEFSMTNPGVLAEYVGFTADEVKQLGEKYGMDYEETRSWYNGYHFPQAPEIYSPKSVVDAMLSGQYDNYWNRTETYEALRRYIELNFDGLKETVIQMLAGSRKKINTGKFSNDMTTFESADDVLTLLIHLGYLAYDSKKEEVYIPNKEISREFYNAVEGAGWQEVARAIRNSWDLLENVWRLESDKVAAGIEQAHYETSVLQYNDENALSYTISLALYAAREYYTVIRELPTGKGYADIVYIPRKKYADKPALVVELKWNMSAEGAIAQIKKRQYVKALEEYTGNLLLVGINYSKEKKEHSCVIERVEMLGRINADNVL